MIPPSVRQGTCRIAPAASQSRSAQTFKAFYATIRNNWRQPPAPAEPEDVDPSDKDFIMSILRANPSLRDTRSYLASFGPRPKPPSPAPAKSTEEPAPTAIQEHSTKDAIPPDISQQLQSPVVASILNPIVRRTALVKIQAPFTDRQLESIATGMVYLEKLGLVSVIVVENDSLPKGEAGERAALSEETMRVVNALEKQGAKARPVLGAVVRLGPKPGDDELAEQQRGFVVPEAHTFPSDLVHIRSALQAGEIPVLPPLALDSFCRSVRVDASDVVAALTRGMVEAAAQDGRSRDPGFDGHSEDMDLTPLRLMIINKEGGVPSYARSGLPHLLVNLNAEYPYIQDTFDPRWRASHPTALSNLALARTCLEYMPPSSSAVMVSHRSPSSLIANLITNKPAVSSSLPHALLQGNRKLTPATPTLLRRGLPVRVIRTLADVDKVKLKALLEQSFQRILDEESFWHRLETHLDYVIVAGDYAGAAVVTREGGHGADGEPITYLDKFAVLPSHQGDGTVDFLWVALHDESYGLGLPFSANPNGGKEGKGEGRDLVWRSRADNPVNKWYFERSSGHIRMGRWVLFWCDAEVRLKTIEGRRGSQGLSYVEDWEHGRLTHWAEVVDKIPSSWKK
ncbi:mitochondrial amino-acid acetyltransferase [Rhodofomes roseus]|uniref:Amino-acid acetyltransferase, mitochondrial n=1 Tax=Rhodofomes roseus TaxID=34475 RepID=A0ABQ8KHF7_9APHY|nr:mitochondrial amino-acid acetyltransferase [Rhodofomes roseus]KAH9837165.1 mitochondrial amino-acid acetyltransferase [Rhodofomes roseus]